MLYSRVLLCNNACFTDTRRLEYMVVQWSFIDTVQGDVEEEHEGDDEYKDDDEYEENGEWITQRW